MSLDDLEDVDLTVEEVLATTEDALLCKFDTGDEIWISRRFCGGVLDVKGDSGEISLPHWLADKEGLV